MKRDFIGVAQAIGHHAGAFGIARVVHTDDEAIAAIAVIAQRTRLQTCAHGEPEPALRIFQRVVAWRKWHAINLAEHRSRAAIALQGKHAALLVAQVRQEKRAVAAQRNTIGFEHFSIHRLRRIKALAAIGANMRHAAAPIGGIQITLGRGQHAFWPDQALADPVFYLQGGRLCNCGWQ